MEGPKGRLQRSFNRTNFVILCICLLFRTRCVVTRPLWLQCNAVNRLRRRKRQPRQTRNHDFTTSYSNTTAIGKRKVNKNKN